MGKEKLKADFFPLRFMTSRKEYRCDGCAGEFPIPADCLYARTAYKDAQGKAHGMILCIRCACAIGSKQKHTTRPLELAPGGLLDELATLHLKETLAWTKGDRKAIDAAKTTYAKRSRKSGTCWPL